MIEQPTALITGASRGIGRAIALEMAQRGYAVAVNYVRSRESADEVVQHISAAGGSAVAVPGNVGLRKDRDSIVDQTLARFGRIDLLVNNAGITSPGRMDLLEATEENWDLVFDTNLKGAFFLAQRAAREMVSLISAGAIARGTIVNVSSISAYAVSTNRVDYCIAKAGIQMMTWLLASRLAEEQIRVYEICPGVIASDMTAPVTEKYDKLIAEGLSPIRRWGQPEDVAKAVATVASDAFPFSTGDRINVDGGFHIRRL
ncbi:MAG: 3-ketoacyl-ACP reductase [Planctomycetota bacterium]|nr:3-ketoacyl-ACP reductase [Planctomycetota bacterium]